MRYSVIADGIPAPLTHQSGKSYWFFVSFTGGQNAEDLLGHTSTLREALAKAGVAEQEAKQLADGIRGGGALV